MYAVPSGHMPQWLQWTLGGLIVVRSIAIFICMAGLATPISTAIGGGLFGVIVGGAVTGAYLVCARIASIPMPGARVLAGAAACVILLIDIFN